MNVPEKMLADEALYEMMHAGVVHDTSIGKPDALELDQPASPPLPVWPSGGWLRF